MLIDRKFSGCWQADCLMDADRQFNGWMREWFEEDEWIESWMECALSLQNGETERAGWLSRRGLVEQVAVETGANQINWPIVMSSANVKSMGKF